MTGDDEEACDEDSEAVSVEGVSEEVEGALDEEDDDGGTIVVVVVVVVDVEEEDGGAEDVVEDDVGTEALLVMAGITVGVLSSSAEERFNLLFFKIMVLSDFWS